MLAFDLKLSHSRGRAVVWALSKEQSSFLACHKMEVKMKRYTFQTIMLGTALSFMPMLAAGMNSPASYPVAKISQDLKPQPQSPADCARCFNGCYNAYEDAAFSCGALDLILPIDDFGVAEGELQACMDQAESNYNQCMAGCHWIPGCA